MSAKGEASTRDAVSATSAGSGRGFLRLLCTGLGEGDLAAVEAELRRTGRPFRIRACASRAELERESPRRWSAILAALDSAALPPAAVLDTLAAGARDMPVIGLVGADQEGVAISLMQRGLGDYVLRQRLDRLVPVLVRERRAAVVRRAFRRRGQLIKEREHRLAGLLESFYEVYYRCSPEGTLLDVSPSIAARSGYLPSELVGRNVRELYADPGDRDRVLSELMKTGLIEDLPVGFRLKSGEVHEALMRARLVRDADGRPVAIDGALRDVTERKRMEDALRQSEQRYRLLVESAADPIFSLDREGTFLFVNQVAARYFGREAKDFVGTRMWDWFPPAVADWQAQQVREVIDQGAGRTVENHSEVAGQARWFSADIRPIRDSDGIIRSALVISRDITSVRLAGEQLRRTEVLYRTLAENFPNGSVFLFDRQLRFTVAEGSGLLSIGPSRDQLVGRTPCEVFPPDVCGTIEPAYRAALSGESAVLEVPYSGRMYEVHVLPVRGGGEDYVQGMVMTQDITARKRAEKEREELIGELREALASIKTLRGLIPICSACKKIRNDRGYWQQVDDYVREHSEATFSHGLCGDCARRLYPEFAEDE
jgi:PAS domain S-box-containing protein